MKKILETSQDLPFDLFQLLLEKHDIPTMQIDKTDSAYVMLGHKELFVRSEDFDKALELLEEFKENQQSLD